MRKKLWTKDFHESSGHDQVWGMRCGGSGEAVSQASRSGGRRAGR
ncbi:hypothetical protein I553_4329 [Mycobacterium xenopi 4042]|uniref:Uncharacterized protein n=1 Tax=Mycobacterium xenopi 4042 TaxID=1299334 RepID=X8AGC9_MYCXE|nr:hypothetical protein I553_4329 [Mycobacterium xenopi 4042]